MVWGMSIPSSFGDFWPDGQFEGHGNPLCDGWSERLFSFYETQPLDMQKSLFEFRGNMTYPSFVTEKFTHEINSARPGEQAYTPIEVHELPMSFNTEKTYSNLASLIALNSGILAVDVNLKEIIERLEPSKHQFFPIDIIMPRGRVYPTQYYIIVFGQYFDSFLPEQSKNDAFRPLPGSDLYYYDGSKKSITGIAVARSVSSDAQLWRERRLRGALICFSDNLNIEIGCAGLRLPRRYKMMEA